MPHFISGFQAGLQKRALMGREASQALQDRVAEQEMAINREKLAELTANRQRKAAQDAVLKQSMDDFQWMRIQGVDVPEAALATFGVGAASTGEHIDDFIRAAVTLQQEKLEGPLRRNKLQAEIDVLDARERAIGEEKTTAAPADVRTAFRKTELRRAIAAESNSARKADLQLELTDLETETARPGTTVFDPQTGRPLVQIGGKSGTKSDVPVSVTANVTERLGQNQKSLELLNEFQASVRPRDVGIQGVIGEKVFDKLLPQFGVATADASRMDSRTKLKALTEGLMRQVSADSRFSVADRIAIERILPSAGLLESYENAVQVSDTLRKVFAKRALIDAQEAKLEPPEWALSNLSDDGLLEALESKLITPEQARSAYLRNRAR